MMRRNHARGVEITSPRDADQLRFAGAIGETITVTGTITRKEKVLGRRYSTVSTLLEIDCGTSIVTIFSTARWVEATEVGEHITVAGTVKKHQRWRGAPHTLLGWTARLDNQALNTQVESIRVAEGWPAGEVTVRRRFPDNPDPATPPGATPANATVRREP